MRFTSRLFSSRQPASGIQSTQVKADAGEVEAQFGLGVMFANGTGVGQDFSQAAHWYGLAADQSYPKAEFNLGMLFAAGQGVTRDDLKAMALFSKAAARGHSGAQYHLGLRLRSASYQTGAQAAVEYRVEAYKWFRLASAVGYPGSVEAFEQVALGLNREQAMEGNRRADLFLTKISS